MLLRHVELLVPRNVLFLVRLLQGALIRQAPRYQMLCLVISHHDVSGG